MSLTTTTIFAALAITGLLTAQTGSFSTYGKGCAGTGKSPSTCISHNAGGGSFRYLAGNANRFAVRFQTKASITMAGFEFYTRTIGSTTSATITTNLFAASSSGRPTGQPLASGTMTINKALGWHKTTFAKSIKLKANTSYFVAYVGSSRIYAPLMSSGTKIHHSYRTSSFSSWSATVTYAAWAVKINCMTSGGAVPVISASNLPKIGKPFGVELKQATPNAPAVLLIGASQNKMGAFKLPLDLTVAGATGCSLQSSIEIWVVAPSLSSAQGSLTLSLAIPASQRMIMVPFYCQWIVVDPKANKLGLVFSKGGLILPGA